MISWNVITDFTLFFRIQIMSNESLKREPNGTDSALKMKT